MTTSDYQSWGQLDSRVRRAVSIHTFEERERQASPGAYLPFGNGRSYGDSCHNDTGALIDNRTRSRINAFDPGTGILSCDPGVTLRQVLERTIPIIFSCRSRPEPPSSQSAARSPTTCTARTTMPAAPSATMSWA